MGRQVWTVSEFKPHEDHVLWKKGSLVGGAEAQRVEEASMGIYAGVQADGCERSASKLSEGCVSPSVRVT